MANMTANLAGHHRRENVSNGSRRLEPGHQRLRDPDEGLQDPWSGRDPQTPLAGDVEGDVPRNPTVDPTDGVGTWTRLTQ